MRLAATTRWWLLPLLLCASVATAGCGYFWEDGDGDASVDQGYVPPPADPPVDPPPPPPPDPIPVAGVQAAMDGSGLAVLAWERDGIIHVAWLDALAADSLSDEITFVPPAGIAYRRPQVAVGPGSVAFVAWENGAGAPFAARIDLLTGATATATAESAPSISFDHLRVAADTGGGALVVWGDRLSLWARRYDPASGWATSDTPVARESGSVTYRFPAVAATSDDEIVVVFQENEYPRVQIAANVWSGGGFRGLELLSDPAIQSAVPCITAEAAGGATAAWTRNGSSGPGTRRYSTSTGWSTEESAGTGPGGALIIQIGGDASGIDHLLVQDPVTSESIVHRRDAAGWDGDGVNLGSLTSDLELVVQPSGAARLLHWGGPDLNVPALRTYQPATGWEVTSRTLDTPSPVSGSDAGGDIATDASGAVVAAWGWGETVHLFLGRPPTPDFTTAPLPDLGLLLDASSSVIRTTGGTLATVEWDFDNDGTYDSTTNPVPLYRPPGTYTIGLRVTDDFGFSAEITREVTLGEG